MMKKVINKKSPDQASLSKKNDRVKFEPILLQFVFWPKQFSTYIF